MDKSTEPEPTDRDARWRELVLQADSMLSLLRHRGDIRNWGGTGFVEQYEVDYLIGQLRRAYERNEP